MPNPRLRLFALIPYSRVRPGQTRDGSGHQTVEDDLLFLVWGVDRTDPLFEQSWHDAYSARPTGNCVYLLSYRPPDHNDLQITLDLTHAGEPRTQFYHLKFFPIIDGATVRFDKGPDPTILGKPYPWEVWATHKDDALWFNYPNEKFVAAYHNVKANTCK